MVQPHFKYWEAAKWLCIASCVLSLLFAIVMSEPPVTPRGFTQDPYPTYTAFYVSACFALAATTCWIISSRQDCIVLPTKPILCHKCQYDRTGLPPDAPCPECNSSPKSAAAIQQPKVRASVVGLSVCCVLLILMVWNFGRRVDANAVATVGLLAIPLLYAWRIDAREPGQSQRSD